VVSAVGGVLGNVTALLVVGPLLGAAVLAAASVTGLGRRVADPAALAVALAATLGAAWTAVVGQGAHVVWPGGWLPRQGDPRGVAVVLDRPAALMVCLVGLLTVVGLVYSWRFFPDTAATFHVLVLVFLGACAGFVLAGDVFDAFVWFELMGVAAYALTGLRIEEPRSVHGALSFGIVNTVGASMSLTGVAVLYAATGELNMAAIGTRLPEAPPRLAIVACTLLLCGVLVKMALVPFHFWTADAEAVAPTPVCVLLSGAMVTVGAFAVVRWWWVVFAGSVPAPAIRHALLGFGVATALVGGVMCLAQRHVKRLLAYSTVAHSGVIACGIALLTGPGVAAAALYAVGHACAKGALFLVTGVLLNRFQTLDEHELFGRATRMRVAGIVFVVAGLALAGLPPLGTWAGKAAYSTAAGDSHVEWLVLVVVAVSVMTGGAVLRVGLRVFAGAGDRPAPDVDRHEEEPESETPGPRGRATTLLPPLLLLAVALLPGLWPAAADIAASAGAQFTEPHRYVHAVLAGVRHASVHVSGESPWSAYAVGEGLVSAALACAVAAAGAWSSRIPGLARAVVAPVAWMVRGLRGVHHAHVGDYISWLLVGVAVFGATMLLTP
jgi:multicomponent Na+:H+ antiporter subunit D